MPCNRALYDCAFIAWVVTMKYAYLMPLDRIQAMLASQGVHVAMGTLVHLVERATELADAVDGEHMKQLKAGKYICFDGTGLKVLIPGQKTAWDGYLEVYTRDELTVFQFDLTKHADELRERLALVEAVLVTDAESRNKAGAPGATFAHCNAHVVRKLREAIKVQPELAREGLDYLDALYDIEDEARRAGLTGEKLASYRQNGRPILERFNVWLHRVAEANLPFLPKDIAPPPRLPQPDETEREPKAPVALWCPGQSVARPWAMPNLSTSTLSLRKLGVFDWLYARQDNTGSESCKYSTKHRIRLVSLDTHSNSPTPNRVRSAKSVPMRADQDSPGMRGRNSELRKRVRYSALCLRGSPSS